MAKILEQQGDIINTVNVIFLDAIKNGASDIHLEPLKDRFIIRHRVDGVLKIEYEGDLGLYHNILARIKVIANLDVTGFSRPQEGNIKFRKDEYEDVDLRVSVLPVSDGECVVIRILEGNMSLSSFSDLGFFDEQIEEIEKIIKKPFGLILVTGPTGSGKSTTIFSILNKLNIEERSIVTLEDPVERKIEMVRQTNINPKRGLSFAEGLRYLMRQDPDVIMVGEIRDQETAKIAVQAAVTGSLVLATIHTNSAAGAIVRLLNMGVEPFLLSSALKFISAQRLGRKNCKFCEQEYIPSPDLLNMFDIPKNQKEVKFFHSVGCEECNNRGFKGRVAFHEILVISKKIEEIILSKPSDEQIKEVAVKEGMMSLRQTALQRVFNGDISLEEAIRLTE